MHDDLHIREATESDTEQILGLLRTSLGEGSIPRHLEYWSWKHRSNPFGASPVLVAEANGRLVGLRVFMRWAWEREGKEVRAVRAVDTATHPDWRGRGIFTRLTLALVEKMGAEGVSFVFNTPNELSRPGYLKMEWSIVGRVTLWVHPRRPLRTLGSLATQRSADSLELKRENRDSSASEGRSVTSLLAQPELEHLLDASRAMDSRLATPVSLRYLRWRYVDIPGFEYRAAWSLDDEDGAAVIFRYRTRGRLRELRLCEVLVGTSLASVRRASSLVRAVLRETSADYAVAMAASRTPARRALLCSGFLPVPRLGPVLTVRPLSRRDGETMPLHRSAWRLSIGDLELF